MTYILANGPYDSVFIGPFETFDAADNFAAEMRDAHDDFGFLSISEAERDANVASFGPLNTVSPDEWRLANQPREEDPGVQRGMVRDPKTGFFEW